MDEPSRARIRVLVIDDSQTIRRLALRVLEGTGRFQVVGLADTGRGAARAVERTAADVVLLDLEMPEVDGLAATAEILAARPRPIVLFCSVSDPRARERAILALEAGAVALVPKPGPGADPERVAQELIRAVEAAATSRPGPSRPRRALVARSSPRAAPRLIAVGASTGGPPAIRRLLGGLPADGPPVLIVQHILPGFLADLARWLDGECPQEVVIAEAGAAPRPGRVYFAPDDRHLAVEGGVLALLDAPPARGHRPSVDVLFESVARDLGPAATGVLLTGMGEDGARGLLALRRAGGWTIAQDEATSVVHGMPRAAVDLDAAAAVLPLDDIAGALAAPG